MKCQAWVDPDKFNKKGKPTARSSIGTYHLDWDRFISEVKGTLRTKREAQRARAVRCGGHLTFSMMVEYDEGGETGGIETEVRCDNCQEYLHGLGLNSEVVEQWIQERLDARESQ
jgi:hypothetical protein